MENFIYVEGYKSALTLKETEIAIKDIRERFESLLSKNLDLTRVTAPLFVESNQGINDGLSGKEVPVNFSLKDFTNKIEIVHSLAKWKRLNINRYGFKVHQGLYTDMNAIRKDELRDNYHSIYVDQWDFELIINENDRNLNFLKTYVKKIYKCVYDLEQYVELEYKIKAILPKEISFITSEELLQIYPNLNPNERVNEYVKKHKAVFVIGIGNKLSNNMPHDDRAPDYDDWNLNGDIYLYNPILDNAIEISSLGIRVDKVSLVKQLKETKQEDYLKYDYHQKILNDVIPLTFGGGIGQSRVCLFMLKKLHIGEVQASLWSQSTKDYFEKRGVILL